MEDREIYYDFQCLLAESFELKEPFVSRSLRCFTCGYDLTKEGEKLKHGLITGCPKCGKSFCE
jgi:DNA-directed RNA polymerase subunit RPC12/RpoP